MLMLFLTVIFVAFFFAHTVSKRSQPYIKASDYEKTSWFEQTSNVVFLTPTGSPTASFTPTVPTATMTLTGTSTYPPTATQTSTATALLQTNTPPAFLPSGTPLLQLNAAETEIIKTLSAAAAAALPTLVPTPDAWFEMIGNPGAVNADLIYANAGCSWMGVGGLVSDGRGDPVIGIHVQIGGFKDESIHEALSGQFPVYGEAGYEITLARPVQEFRDPLWIQLLNDALIPVSEKVYFRPSSNCEKSLIMINFKKTK